MKTINQVILLTVSNVLSKVLSLIFFVILARIFLPEEYGLFRYLLSLAMLISIPITGFPVAITKFLSQHKNNKTEINKYFSNAIFIISNMFIITSVLILIISNNKLYLALLCLSICLEATYQGTIRGLYVFKKIFLFNILANIIKVILVLIAYYFFKIQFNLFIFAFSIATLISIFLLEVIFKSNIKINFKLISKKTMKNITFYAIPVMFGSISYDIMQNIDSIFLKQMVSIEAVGYYGVARTLLQSFVFIPLALKTIILPKTSYTYHNENDKLKEIIKKINLSILGTIIISLIILTTFIIFGKSIIMIIFGNEYIEAYTPLIILSIGQIFLVIFTIISTYFRSVEKHLISLKVIVLGCILNVILNFIFIQKYGLTGAAIATTITLITISTIIGIIYLKEVFKNEHSD